MFNKFFLFFVAIGPFHVTLDLTKKNFLLVFLIEMTFHSCYGFRLNYSESDMTTHQRDGKFCFQCTKGMSVIE